ncbi:MAG TPA: ATP-binding cassette domain-containing protein, partial [Thermoanaerobaculia bacterium]|nr:ATP-binding cassette domain-containing protein [Thermoanaerobaculia bacterium]
MADSDGAAAIRTRTLNLWYGTFQALFDVDLDVKRSIVTSLIGPSGCGKSTLLRTVNRITERLGYVRTTGSVEVLGHDIFGPDVALPRLRRQVGMVSQRPNPLPLSVRDNVLFGLRLHDPDVARDAAVRDELLERSLRQVMLWDAVKDRLD